MVVSTRWAFYEYFVLLDSVSPTRNEADAWWNIDIYILAAVLLSVFVTRSY